MCSSQIDLVYYNSTQFWHQVPGDRLGAQPHDMPIVSSSPQVMHSFCSIWLLIGGSEDLLPFEFGYLLEQVTELRLQNWHLPSYYIIKDMIKNTDEQPDEETRRVESGGSWPRSFCPHRVGVHHVPSTWVCSLTLKLSKLGTCRPFMETSSRRHNELLTSFPAPSPFSREGELGLKIPNF